MAMEEAIYQYMVEPLQNNSVNSESMRRMTTYKIRYRVLQTKIFIKSLSL
ncbi:hypothetical protein Syun_002270 [Stephania yunnanensis]|uniref:Uncharacterized protein n=1 Tax=Stephania yunnanensis TaxID=152371 RepID=A0AAP0LIB3_9MAGN